MSRISQPVSGKHQQGVALITAILLVAIATLIAAKLSWDNQISIRRTETTLNQEQARLIALSGEAIAIDILRLDDTKEFDYLGSDVWNSDGGLGPGVLPPWEIDIEEMTIGKFQGRLADAQGRLNVNNLLPDPDAPPDPVVVGQFKELFNILGLNPGLVDAIVDWIDADTVPLTSGAEDGSYTALDPGYRTANNYITSISELRAVIGIDEETFQLLKPHLTALQPDWCGGSGAITPVNLNYASAQVMLAASTTQDENMGLGEAEVLVEQREDGGWESLDEITGMPDEMKSSNLVSVKTECLELYVTVEIGSSVLTMYSLLDRSSSGDSDIVTRVRAYGLE
jgi:general secretion pathway protein K